MIVMAFFLVTHEALIAVAYVCKATAAGDVSASKLYRFRLNADVACLGACDFSHGWRDGAAELQFFVFGL